MKFNKKMRVRYGLLFLTAISFVLSSVNLKAEDLAEHCNNQAFLQAQQQFEKNTYPYSKTDVRVHVCGTVIAFSQARYTRSGEHGYFYLKVSPSVSIRIVSNLDEMTAPPWPWVKKGDYVEVAGRYYYDSPRRQGIDWTHKGTSRKWPYSGYVTVNGTKYD